jgi:DNA-binding NtrC family response regulator
MSTITGPSVEIPRTILIVEADQFARDTLSSALSEAMTDLVLAPTASEALALSGEIRPDLLLVSLELPEQKGVVALDVFQQRMPGVPVIAVSAMSSIQVAIDSMRHGAVDVISLDSSPGEWGVAVRRALLEARSNRALESVRSAVHDRYGFSRLLSQSPRMLDVFDEVRKVAGTDATVLILGETGTGKELVSRAIHERSGRKDKPFISVNCGAFTETLLESELFGHEKGSFTGAVDRRAGLFEMADKGTLFLDELGETTPNTQVNLLRVLEEMTFRRVGGREQVQVDVRIIAATHVNLELAVEEGKFRRDLFYRLNVFPIRLPPLHERPEDIPLLMRHFLEEVAEEYAMEPPTIAAEAMTAIMNFNWPGNVRQLRAMCERWVITRSGRRLEREQLPPEMTGGRAIVRGISGFHINEHATLKDNTARALSQVERGYLYRVLKLHRGHLENSAKAAGMTRRTLYTKMKEYGLEARKFR